MVTKKDPPRDAPAPTLRQTLGLHSAGQPRRTRVKAKPHKSKPRTLLQELKQYRRALDRRRQEAEHTYQRCCRALSRDFGRSEGPQWEQTGDEVKWRQAREESRTLAQVIENLDGMIARYEEEA